jgi:hypothetical protein
MCETFDANPSFETYEELRRHAGLPHRDVVRTLQELAQGAP